MNEFKFIEIIGPPGVGKTTLYNSLCNTWNPICNWTHQHALLDKKPEFSDFNNWLHYSFKKLIKKNGFRSLPVELGMRFIKEHNELADFCWEYLSEVYKYDNDKRYRLTYFLFTDFCKYQMIIESKNENPCFINEGLMQKSFFVDDEEDELYSQLKQYTSLLPAPYAIINMNIDDSSVIVDRLLSRKKVIASHVGKTNENLKENIVKWQSTLRSMVEIMSERGVKVFNVDGEKSTKENVNYIKQELNIT